MMVAAVCGLLCGAATMGISEFLIGWWGARPTPGFWKLSLLGVVVRTIWVLGVLVLVLTLTDLEPRAFTIGLMASYLAAQIMEGIRYQRLIGTK